MITVTFRASPNPPLWILQLKSQTAQSKRQDFISGYTPTENTTASQSPEQMLLSSFNIDVNLREVGGVERQARCACVGHGSLLCLYIY